MLNVPSQISRHLCCRLRLSITCCARLLAVVQVCISCLSGHLALLSLLFAQPQSLGVFSCDSKAYLRVFSSDLNTHLTPSYPAYSNIGPLFILRHSNQLPLTGEVPVMVDSARKELECPICMEVMMPPARIWQCKVN